MNAVVFPKPFAEQVKGRHPGSEEVAVLEKHPTSLSLASLHHLSRHSLLTLAQALVLESFIEIHLVSELDHLLCGVRSLA